MLEAPPWDLVVVDEAHHLNSDDKSGPTLGYHLLEKLVKGNASRIDGVFHRNTAPRQELRFLVALATCCVQICLTRNGHFRNSSRIARSDDSQQQAECDRSEGSATISPAQSTPQTYAYSDEESRFYAMLTEFIATGKAYASTLSSSDQRTVILVLISMQKLASSSVAAIRRALNRRLQKLRGAKREACQTASETRSAWPVHPSRKTRVTQTK